MATIVFIDDIGAGVGILVIQDAIDHLIAAGHQVIVPKTASEAEHVLRDAPIQILFCGLCPLGRGYKHFCNIVASDALRGNTSIFVFTIMTEDGEAFRDWSIPVTGFLLGRNLWSVVLAVEQALHSKSNQWPLDDPKTE